MARKIKSPEDGSETEVEDLPESPEATPIVNEPEPIVEPVSAAIPIVNMDDEIARESAPIEQQRNGVSYWFGHVGMLKFPDKTEYHVRANRVFITDLALIANLTEAAKNPANKIFPQ